MKKKLLTLLVLFVVTTTAADTINIKNDTNTDYFIVINKTGHLLEPDAELQTDIEQVGWFKSWWYDLPKIILFKKIGDQEGFVKTFEIKPSFGKDNDSVVIFISDVQRKARHVSAPFTVTKIDESTAQQD